MKTYVYIDNMLLLKGFSIYTMRLIRKQIVTKCCAI